MDDVNQEEMPTIEIKNAMFINPKRFLPWHKAVFIDLPKILAFDLFERAGISPWGFSKMENEDLPYVGVVCRVWKWDVVGFFECMVELRKLILMCGHGDYDKFCQEIIGDEMTDELEITTDD